MPALILILAAWDYGGVEAPVFWIIGGLSVAAVTLALAWGRRLDESTPRARLWDWRWGGPLLALLGYMAVQALNASHACSPADAGLTPRPHLRWLPSSVDARTTGLAMIRLAAYGAVFWLVGATVADRRGRRVFLYLLVAAGFAMAVLALAQRMGPKNFAIYPLTGRFVGENNYAAYANLLFPVALALGRREQVRARERGAGSHPGYLLYLAAGTLVASVIASTSITGIAVCLGTLLLWVAIECRRAHASLRGMLAAVALLGATAAVALTALGPRALSANAAVGQLPTWRAQAESRAGVYGATLRMFRDRWGFGIGAGTFALGFPYYQPRDVGGFYRYAHQDYLQYLAELGLAGSALLAATAAGVVGRIRPAAVWNSTTRRGVAVALFGVAGHALMDFPLHIPAIALLAVAWLALLTLPAQGAGGRSKHPAGGGC